MNDKISIAILVTNYNTWDLTERCVRNCLECDVGNFKRLLVYDDCSTRERPKSFPAGVEVFRAEINSGLVKALNAAFRQINEDVVVVFDSDAYPTTPFCKEVSEVFAKDPMLGMVAFKTIGREGKPTESYSTEPNIWSILLGSALYAKAERWLCDKSGRISVFTCAMAVRREAFEEVGGFDEDFDWLDLDHDLSMRMNRSQWKLTIVSTATAYHEGSGTPQLTRERVNRFYKARWHLLDKYDRLPMRRLTKILIIMRLFGEYLCLVTIGRAIFRDKSTREDKVRGREDLLRLCLRGLK